MKEEAVSQRRTSPQAEELDTLYRRERPRLQRMIRARARGIEDVADLIQEAFTRYAETRLLGSIGNPAAYLNRIARNLLFDRLRRKEQSECGILEEVDNCLVAPAEQEWQIEASQLMDRYHQAVAAFPRRTREVFVLHRVHGLRYKQIAVRLGISLRTVEWHMTEALGRLRRALDDE